MCPVTTGFSKVPWMAGQLQGTNTKICSFTGRLGDDSPVIIGATLYSVDLKLPLSLLE
jgi:hypothetical protein